MPKIWIKLNDVWFSLTTKTTCFGGNFDREATLKTSSPLDICHNKANDK